MKRVYGLEQVERDATSVVTVGTFDGVHLGHQAIIRYLGRRAAAQKGSSVVVTFDPHPREVVRGELVPLLTTIEERADIMETMGVDRFVVIPFTPEFARLSGQEFVERVLFQTVGLREIVVGHDHGFGRGRGGDKALLEQLGLRLGFAVDLIPAQVVEEHVVSSSEIRHLIVDEGDVSLAGQMLNRYYTFTGVVERGDGRGRQIGFPTANLRPLHTRKVLPKVGVYAVRVFLPIRTDPYAGMMNIGVRPTFGESTLRLEVHILDFAGDLYDHELRIEFIARLRDELRFESVEALKEQLSQDRERCKQAIVELF
jgi:riboflavin kinase / FMN adenylyltransferase